MERQFDGPPPATPVPEGAIDTQTHIYLPGFPAAPGAIPLPEGLPSPADYARVMRRLGTERVIITQSNAHQCDNANLSACLAAMGDVARGVAAITGAESDATLAALADAGIVGARIMDLPGGAVSLASLEAVDATASRMGWMIAVQFDASNIVALEPSLSRLKSRWVLDHHGKFFSGAPRGGPERAALKRLIDGGHVWYKVAGCYESSRAPAPYADIADLTHDIAHHAPERIVWGTNWPHNLIKVAKDYPDDAALMDLVLGWLPSDAARRAALLTNPEALYNWPAG
ncbi:MAG: amidohydrolase family protein [Paracoccaceae bacterium]|nr:amidohydrolase family protein [Paracoccaceae bacterium]